MLRLNNPMKNALPFILCLSLCLSAFGFQFGNGTDDSTMEFVKVSDNVKSVTCCGWTKTYIVKNDGSLWGTGMDIYEPFGMGGQEIERSFVKIMDNVQSFDGLILKKADGSVWYAYNGMKRLPDNFEKQSHQMYIIGGNLYAQGTDSHGCFGGGSKNVYYGTPHLVRSGITDVYCSGYSTQIVSSDGGLWVSGEHYLPKPYENSIEFFKLAENVRAVDAGFYITANDELYAFGFAAQGALGVGEVTDDILPTKIMDDVRDVTSNLQVTLILKNDSTLYGCGGRTPNYYGELGFGNLKPVLVPKKIADDVVSMAVGIGYTAYVKSDGCLWMCGANEIPAMQ